jgi:ribosomal protein S18 acetylase RimI-like enzyme
VVQRLESVDSRTLAGLESAGREALGDSALDRWMIPVVAMCGFLFVAQEGPEIVGAAEIICTRAADELYLEGLYVRPAFQQRGYGRRILQEAMDALTRAGYGSILATVAPDNVAARRLYESAGFIQIDEMPELYGAGKDRLLLSRRLT